MRYTEFRDSIKGELARYPEGRTWVELKASLKLPCKQPCPTWVARLEEEVRLDRSSRKGRAKLWKLTES